MGIYRLRRFKEIGVVGLVGVVLVLAELVYAWCCCMAVLGVCCRIERVKARYELSERWYPCTFCHSLVFIWVFQLQSGQQRIDKVIVFMIGREHILTKNIKIKTRLNRGHCCCFFSIHPREDAAYCTSWNKE